MLDVIEQAPPVGSLGQGHLAGDAVVPILIDPLGHEMVGDGPGPQGLLLNLDGYAAGVVFAGSLREGRMGTKRFFDRVVSRSASTAEKSSVRPIATEKIG